MIRVLLAALCLFSMPLVANAQDTPSVGENIWGTPISVRATPFPGLVDGPIKVSQCLKLESGLLLFGPKAFGGISSMAFGDHELWMLSDTARMFRAGITFDDNGFVNDVTNVRRKGLADANGELLKKSNGDSEALAMIDPGRIIVSFEGDHRASLFQGLQYTYIEQQRLVDWDREILGRNRGFEAMTPLAEQDGWLFISEGIDGSGRALAMIYSSLTSDVTHSFFYKPTKDFRVTDVAKDDQSGDIFVLERAFSRLRGPRARIVRVNRDALNAVRDDEVIEGTELGRLHSLHGIDNMEAMVVRRGGADGLFNIHLMSDDNFNDVQRTVLMGFSVPDSTACGKADPTSGEKRRLVSEARPAD